MVEIAELTEIFDRDFFYLIKEKEYFQVSFRLGFSFRFDKELPKDWVIRERDRYLEGVKKQLNEVLEKTTNEGN